MGESRYHVTSGQNSAGWTGLGDHKRQSMGASGYHITNGQNSAGWTGLGDHEKYS